MAFGIAATNLRRTHRGIWEGGRPLSLLLRVEAWLDARASRRVLYRLDGRALADIGLTEADLGRVDPAASWQSVLLPSAKR